LQAASAKTLNTAAPILFKAWGDRIFSPSLDGSIS